MRRKRRSSTKWRGKDRLGRHASVRCGPGAGHQESGRARLLPSRTTRREPVYRLQGSDPTSDPVALHRGSFDPTGEIDVASGRSFPGVICGRALNATGWKPMSPSRSCERKRVEWRAESKLLSLQTKI